MTILIEINNGQPIPFYSLVFFRILALENIAKILTTGPRLHPAPIHASVRPLSINIFKRHLWSHEFIFFHIAQISSTCMLGPMYKQNLFCFGLIRILFAMATYSFHRLTSFSFHCCGYTWPIVRLILASRVIGHWLDMVYLPPQGEFCRPYFS